VIPDRVDGAADGRDVLGVGEYSVFRFGNPHTGELARQVGKVGDLDAGDVIEIAGIVAVAADAIGDLADPCRDVVDGVVKLVPQVRDSGAAVFVGAALSDA
jgi:hypothetical protein